ncbi:MAG TPA: galactokinase family protein, partial [Planctomycetia bacterium]|nr:galactokinase family protein [Planctomycetia bacterium]
MASDFASIFGRAPEFRAVAHGRVNLVGEHTDYNLGYV